MELLKNSAKDFCIQESNYSNKDLYGITDGKAVGTYIEHKFQAYLEDHYSYEKGSSAKGIDLPGDNIQTDIKVTSIKQPQSSCPFKDAKQKIFGLGYNLLVFVYEKTDDSEKGTATLNFLSCSFLEKSRTADYTTTFRLREMIHDGANKEDIIAYLNDKNIPADEIALEQIAERILSDTPEQGYLTISNALQWRLQYSRIVSLTEKIDGITKLVDKVKQ
ncbi:MAG: restriction endonuclease [Desulfobacteraceae bacterium]|nr:restriction endonuclease [Desulfobacteraceae bacterium]